MVYSSIYDDEKYFIGDKGKQEQMAWDRGMIRYGDQCCAIGYALGYSSFYEIRNVLGFQDTGKNPSPLIPAKKQLEILYDNRRRTPKSVIDIGGGRGEISIAFSHLGIKTQLIEPSKAVYSLVKETQKKFDMYGDFEIINDTFAGSSNYLNKDVDTLIFSEAVEHIPTEEFDTTYFAIKDILDNNNGRVIIVNWVDFHPIPLSGVEHIRIIDNVFYDSLTKNQKVIYRQGSHLIYRKNNINIQNFSPPSFDSNERRAVYEYMGSNSWLTEFEKTKELCKEIAEFVGAKYCVMVPSCTSALAVSLWAIGIGLNDNISKDRVFVPDYTMAASAMAVKMVNAKPVLCDIEKETICLKFDELYNWTNEFKPKALILVSINGRYPTKIKEIIEYCKNENIMIIEDAAQSLGSKFMGKQIGTYGDIGCFSFSPFKTISMGQGGAIVTDDVELYQKIISIKDFARDGRGSDSHGGIGFNFHYTDLQAVVGLEQMKKLPYRLRRKKQIYNLYRDFLGENAKFLPTSDETMLWLNDIMVDRKDELIKYLKLNNINVRNAYPSLHNQKPFQSNEKYPNSQYASDNIIYLPSSPELSDDEIEYVCDKIKHFNRYWENL